MDWQDNLKDDEDENGASNWDRRRRMAVAQVLCYVTYAMYIRHVYYDRHLVDQSATSLNTKKRNAPRDDVCMREFEGIRDAIKDVAEAIREGNVL